MEQSVEILAKTFAKQLVEQGYCQKELTSAAVTILEQAILLGENCQNAKERHPLKVVRS